MTFCEEETLKEMSTKDIFKVVIILFNWEIKHEPYLLLKKFSLYHNAKTIALYWQSVSEFFI